MKKDRYSNLVQNTGIYAIGTFGSKILTYLIVPFYTYVLTAEEYGQIDLFTVTISLMLPFTTLVIYEAVIRFLPSNEIDDEEAISASMVVFLFGIVLTIFAFPLYRYLFFDIRYSICFLIYLGLSAYNQIFSQYLRASQRTLAYTVNGIIVTVVTVSLNLLFLIVFDLGMLGYIYSLIIAQAAASIQCTVAGSVLKKCTFRKVDRHVLAQLLRFSIPLVPTYLTWWLMNAGDKYIIGYYLGAEYNGIYALSMKVPTLLNLVYSIFAQAWQISAIQENNSEDRAVFYSSVYKLTSATLIVTCSAAIMLVKPVFTLIISQAFHESWKFVPMLSIGMVVSCLSSFLGVVYIVSKNSVRSMFTTLIGVVANLVLNVFFITTWGLYGVAIGTLIGYVCIFLIRAVDTKKYIGMSFDMLRSAAAFGILFVQTFLLMRLDVRVAEWLSLALFAVVILLYRAEIVQGFKFLTKFLKNRK